MPDLRLAVRTLIRTPFVTGVAIASLALGIGANTAIFSLIQRLLLRSLPVSEPAQLVNIHAQWPNPGSQSCSNAGSCAVLFSYPMYRDLEQSQTALAGIAAHRTIGADLSFRNKTVSGEGMLVSGSYFSVLGLRPTLGRLLSSDDDRTIGGHPVVVLSHHYWANELGSDPTVLDQSILVNGETTTIIGVGPKGFEGTTLGSRPRIFAPLTMSRVLTGWLGAFENRHNYWIYAFGRLAPGQTREAAAQHLNSIYQPIVREIEAPQLIGASEDVMNRFKTKTLLVEPGHQGQSLIHGQTSTPLLLLLVVTGIVLLVACTNVANLLLARAANRSAEMAIRSSLGAQRGQLIGQLLTESALLAVAAGLSSLLVAQATLAMIVSLLPAQVTRSMDLGMDGSILLFAAALSLGTTFIFGLLPALQATRADLLGVIKANTGRSAGTRRATRFRGGLVTAQIGLSMALLCAAGLFLRSLVNVSRVELGVETENLVSFALSPMQMGYTPVERRNLFRQVETALAGVPGVTGVTSALVPILSGWSNGNDVDVEGFEVTPDTDVNTRSNFVGPDYFRTLGTSVLMGREFTAADDAGAPPVVIVNQEFARKFKLGNEVIGRRVSFGNRLSRPADAQVTWYQIVGLVQNAAYDNLKADPRPLIFRAVHQDTLAGRLVFYARSQGSTVPILRAVPPLVAKLAPDLPVTELKTVEQQARDNVYLDRMITTLSTAFGFLATLLAAVGLYGVLAYNVTLRTREIGVRIALGADAGRVQSLVVRQVGIMTAIGGVLGLAAAVVIGRAAQSLLFGLSAFDLAAFAGAAVVISTVALAAGYLPARRAARIPPTEALRAE